LLNEIEVLGRYLISLDRPIQALKRAIDAGGSRSFPSMARRPGSGVVRKDPGHRYARIDQNPCSGWHVCSTAEIGPHEIKVSRIDGRGVNILSETLLRTWSY
jgi:hypothetical protein